MSGKEEVEGPRESFEPVPRQHADDKKRAPAFDLEEQKGSFPAIFPGQKATPTTTSALTGWKEVASALPRADAAGRGGKASAEYTSSSSSADAARGKRQKGARRREPIPEQGKGRSGAVIAGSARNFPKKDRIYVRKPEAVVQRAVEDLVEQTEGLKIARIDQLREQRDFEEAERAKEAERRARAAALEKEQFIEEVARRSLDLESWSYTILGGWEDNPWTEMYKLLCLLFVSLGYIFPAIALTLYAAYQGFWVLSAAGFQALLSGIFIGWAARKMTPQRWRAPVFHAHAIRAHDGHFAGTVDRRALANEGGEMRRRCPYDMLLAVDFCGAPPGWALRFDQAQDGSIEFRVSMELLKELLDASTTKAFLEEASVVKARMSIVARSSLMKINAERDCNLRPAYNSLSNALLLATHIAEMHCAVEQAKL